MTLRWGGWSSNPRPADYESSQLQRGNLCPDLRGYLGDGSTELSMWARIRHRPSPVRTPHRPPLALLILILAARHVLNGAVESARHGYRDR
jgi:hypothetical protein